MQMYIHKLYFFDLKKSLLCDVKISLYNKETVQKYLSYLNKTINLHDNITATYHVDNFNNFTLNISRTVLKTIQKRMFENLKRFDKQETINLYYILGNHNNFGIKNVELINDKLFVDLQFELFYELKDFISMSGPLANSNIQTYTQCLFNDENDYHYYHKNLQFFEE